MKIIWVLGNTVTVREVFEALLVRRRVAYTTVMTMMNILEKKGYLSKSRDDRAFIYWCSQTKKEVIGGIITEFLERVFDGSATLLLAHLIEDRHLTDNDIEKIRRAMHSERK